MLTFAGHVKAGYLNFVSPQPYLLDNSFSCKNNNFLNNYECYIFLAPVEQPVAFLTRSRPTRVTIESFRLLKYIPISILPMQFCIPYQRTIYWSGDYDDDLVICFGCAADLVLKGKFAVCSISLF